MQRKPRGERAQPGVRESLAGEPQPARLSDSQQRAGERIARALDDGAGANLLLYGATGSGKTEVYLQACAAALERGLGAIVLVPEIALTPQAVGRFRARFGERVALLHSGLTEAERRDERAADRGRRSTRRRRRALGDLRARPRARADLRRRGARSLVQAGVGSALRRAHGRGEARVARTRGRRLRQRDAAARELGGARAASSSAAASPASCRRCASSTFGARRATRCRRRCSRRSNRSSQRGEKAILLLNRRGVAPALHCRACGTTIRCENCDVALVLHGDGALRCHHCGLSEPAPELCPACASAELARIGAGTQRLERELADAIPELARFRLDADTVEHRGVADTLRAFADARGAALIGTQMVAKGHHFAGVALAAVVDADTGLGLPDFRAEERTFQLLTQLAGRSGRDAPGRVLVQTFQPDARAIELAARHDVAGFLAGELERRRELGYPPFRHLVRIVVAGAEAGRAEQVLAELKAGLPGDVLGPAPLLRLRGRFRAQLVAKTDRPRAVASTAARLLSAAAPAMRRHGLTAVVDVDPQSL